MARNSKQLRKTMTLSELYRLSKNVATDYANSVPERARSILMEKYNITESTYYYLLEMAVTHHLVSDKTVQMIREKTLVNQDAHGNHGNSSTNKYNLLEARRKDYSAFKKADIRHIAKYFAEHPEISKKSVSMTFSFTSSKILDQLLLRACKELIVSDAIFEKIKKRGLASAVDLELSQCFFNQLTAYRAEVKRQKRKDKPLF